jgi:hypothetical protein
MRTTVTLDDDVAAKLEALARQKRLSFKEVLNTVLRRGLSSARRGSKAATPYRVETFRSALRPGVDPLRLNQVNDELEVREFGDQTR